MALLYEVANFADEKLGQVSLMMMLTSDEGVHGFDGRSTLRMKGRSKDPQYVAQTQENIDLMKQWAAEGK